MQIFWLLFVFFFFFFLVSEPFFCCSGRVPDFGLPSDFLGVSSPAGANNPKQKKKGGPEKKPGPRLMARPLFCVGGRAARGPTVPFPRRGVTPA